MLSEKLESINEALRHVLGFVDPDRAAVIRECRRNLGAAVEQADALEKNLLVPGDKGLRLMDRPPLAHEMAEVRRG